jgi:hypothetical protein
MAATHAHPVLTVVAQLGLVGKQCCVAARVGIVTSGHPRSVRA